MMKWKWFIPFSCLAVFHTPDGKEIKIDTHVTAIRPTAVQGHLAHGTNAVIYAGGEKFGITETLDQVTAILKNCQD